MQLTFCYKVIFVQAIRPSTFAAFEHSSVKQLWCSPTYQPDMRCYHFSLLLICFVFIHLLFMLIFTSTGICTVVNVSLCSRMSVDTCLLYTSVQYNHGYVSITIICLSPTFLHCVSSFTSCQTLLLSLIHIQMCIRDRSYVTHRVLCRFPVI